MDLGARIKLMGSAVLIVAGISTLVSDYSALFTGIVDEVQANPISILLIAVGLGLAIYALWDEILGVLGIQSTLRLGNQIKDSLHLKHGWSLTESSINKDDFRIVAGLQGRSITFIKAKGERTLLIGSGIVPDAQAKRVIDEAPEAAKGALLDELISHVALIANIQLSLESNEGGSLKRVAIANMIETVNTFSDLKLLEGISAVIRAGAVVEAESRKWARELEAKSALASDTGDSPPQ